MYLDELLLLWYGLQLLLHSAVIVRNRNRIATTVNMQIYGNDYFSVNNIVQ